MERPLRRGGQLKVDTVDLRTIDVGWPENTRYFPDQVVRRRLEYVELGVRKSRRGDGERRRHVDMTDHVGHISPIRIAFKKRLGCQPRSYLFDIVHYNETAGTHKPRRAHEIEQGEFELVITIDQHQVVVDIAA